MGFAERLRMAGVLSPGEGSGMESANGGGGMPEENPLASTLSIIEPFIHNMRNRQIQDTLFFRDLDEKKEERARNLSQSGGTADGGGAMRTVYNPGITPYQQANLDLRRQGQEGQDDRSSADRALRERTIGIQDQEAERRRNEGEQRLNIQKDRAEMYRYRTMNPNAIIKEESDGTFVAIDPVTKKATRVTGSDGVPINSGNLNDEEKANLGVEGRMQVVERQGEIRSDAEKQNQINRLALEEARGRQARETKETPAAPLPDTNQRRTVFDAAGNPRASSETVTTRGTITNRNTVLIAPDGRRISVPNNEVAEAIRNGAKRDQ